MSIALFGRFCTSSSRFQDNLFDANAIPPEVQAPDYCNVSSPATFDVKKLIDSFRYEAGLKRSLDKIYEIIVYALFSALAEAMNLQVKISVDVSKSELLYKFGDFAEKVMRLNYSYPSRSEPARIFRAGVTNAAVIQLKHLSLDEELAEDITTGVSSDKVIIVCRDAEINIILSLLTQIGWRSHIQSIITENDLALWYEKALRGKYSAMTGEKILSCLRMEIASEFPTTNDIPSILESRRYKKLTP